MKIIHLSNIIPENPAPNFNLNPYHFEEKGLNSYNLDSIIDTAFIELLPEDPYAFCPCGCKNPDGTRRKIRFLMKNEEEFEKHQIGRAHV